MTHQKNEKTFIAKNIQETKFYEGWYIACQSQNTSLEARFLKCGKLGF